MGRAPSFWRGRRPGELLARIRGGITRFALAWLGDQQGAGHYRLDRRRLSPQETFGWQAEPPSGGRASWLSRVLGMVPRVVSSGLRRCGRLPRPQPPGPRQSSAARPSPQSRPLWRNERRAAASGDSGARKIRYHRWRGTGDDRDFSTAGNHRGHGAPHCGAFLPGQGHPLRLLRSR